MENAGTEGAKGIQNRHGGDGKRFGNAKKILNRGNELKDLLKTQHLAVFGAKNELKTNSILSAKSADQSGEVGFRCQGLGVGGWGLGAGLRFRGQESGGRKSRFRVPDVRCQGPEVRLPGSTMRRRYYLPGLAHENMASGTKNPQRGRQHSGSSGTLGRGFTSRPSTFALRPKAASWRRVDFSTSRN
jgi:hypothetical protein